MPVTVSIAAIALLVATFYARTARAEPIRLGLDVDQGVSFPSRYVFDGVLSPGYDCGRLRLALDLGAALDDTKWSFIGGFHPSVVVLSALTSYTGLRLAADISYLSVGDARVTGGLVLDLDSVHFAVSSGYDWFSGSALVMTTVGFDLWTIAGFCKTAQIPGVPGC